MPPVLCLKPTPVINPVDLQYSQVEALLVAAFSCSVVSGIGTSGVNVTVLLVLGPCGISTSVEQCSEGRRARIKRPVEREHGRETGQHAVADRLDVVGCTLVKSPPVLSSSLILSDFR